MNALYEDMVQLAWTQLWQVTLVAVGVGLFITLFCRRRAHLAHMLWLLVLLKGVTPPIWSSPTGVFSWTRIASSPDVVPEQPEADSIAIDKRVPTSSMQTASGQTTGNEAAEIEPAGPQVSREMDEAFPLAGQNEIAAQSSALKHDERSIGNDVAAALIAVWLVGALISAGLSWCSLRSYCRALNKAHTGVDPWLVELVGDLAQRLGIRRRVRLVVVDQAIGPMTYGVLRPTVIMPQAVVACRSSAEVEPLVAHELIHVRRRDALVGLLQVIVQCAWWFHPLVRWANRQVSYERERCCDEEVVAGLGYRPGVYARSLLNVLEVKGRANVLAALPGIRPWEVTKNRLEHIMVNSSQFQKRAPRRYWLVLLAGLLLLAPGAAITAQTATHEEQSDEAAVNPEPSNGAVRVTRFISPDGQRIAYGQVAVGANGEQRVRIILGNVDGTNRRALPVDGQSVDEVYWYGSDRIAYVTEHGQDGYFLMDLNGQPAGRLTMPSGCDSFFHQVLSPDGQSIAFCGNYADLPKEVDSEKARRKFLKAHPEIKLQHGLFVVDLQKQSVRQLLDQTVANQPAWSPDSRFLAAGIGHYVSEYPLVIINVATGEVRMPDVEGVGVAWSPNNAYLAMTTDVVRGGSWRGGVPLDGRLGVWNIDAHQLTLVSPPGVNTRSKEADGWIYSGSYGPVWSGDGEWIAYRRAEYAHVEGGESERREEVWIVRPDGTDGRKVLNHGAAELAWTADAKSLLWVHEGRFGRIDRQIDTSALGPTPAAPTGEFTVEGRVTDDQGQPLPGVEVYVSRGIGTLFSTAPVTTDANGKYRIHFGQGMFSAGANMQYACVFARKPGYYEKNLCRDGNLAMANFKPDDFETEDWDIVGIVYPKHPYRVDFTMLPAATVSVQLVDDQGAPLPNYRLRLDGEKLYPASSVLWSGKTDAEGRATIDQVPLNEYYFSIAARRIEYQTAPIRFDRAEKWSFRLIYDDIAGTLTAERE